MKQLAIIHTTSATIDLKSLVLEMIPGCKVVNFLDDTILPQLIENGGDLTRVQGRVKQYVRFAEQSGADAILEACSSIGELVGPLAAQVSVPVIRIDNAMAEHAVRHASNIGVAATLVTTLQPTTRLLRSKAAELGKTISVTPCLIDGAYDLLCAGDREGHDNLVRVSLEKLAQSRDLVVLAQASMARVLPLIPASDRERFLTSPRLAIEQVRQVLESTEKANARALTGN